METSSSNKNREAEDAQLQQTKKNKASLLDKLKGLSRIRISFKFTPAEEAMNPANDAGQDAKPEKQPKQKKEKKPKPVKVKRTKQDEGDSPKKKPVVLIAILAAAVALGGGAFAFVMLTSGGPTVEERLAEAAQFTADEKYTEAADMYNELIAEDAALTPAYLGLADTNLAQQNVDAAIVTLEIGLEATSKDELIQKKLDEITPVPSEDGAAAPPVTAEPILWTDPALEKMVRLALNKPAPQDILKSDVQGIQTLKIMGATHAVVDQNLSALNTPTGYSINGKIYSEHGEIQSLADLAYFTGLRKLVIGYNKVSDISALSGLRSLETLGLYFNTIKNLGALSDLTSLKFLYLYHNEISDLSPLSGFSDLRELWVQNNQLTDISPVAGMTSLTELYINNNQVTDIAPIAGLAHLGMFYADSNNISDVSPVSQVPTLTDVSFLKNPVADLSPTKGIQNVNKL